MVKFVELYNLCFLSLGVFLLHNLWYHGYLSDILYYFADYDIRKQEKEKWRKRAIKMNLPPKIVVAKNLSDWGKWKMEEDRGES